ncbi:MAG: NfeD family protein [Alphaproteobacteria bacterium]
MENFSIDPVWWLIAGMILGAAEILAPGFVIIWFGLAAIIIAAISWFIPDIVWWVQVFLFTGFTLGLLFVAHKYWKPTEGDTDEPLLNNKAAQLVGRTATLIEPIEDGRGRVRVGDTTWSVTGPDLPEGRKVKIVNAASESVLEVIAR